jgi:N-acetylglucosamine malate deacetylase 1
MPVEVLLFGAHPDDVEWGAGGIAILLKQQRSEFVIVDFTRGERGSRGSVEERALEAVAAAEYLGAAGRENLDLPDCGLLDTPASREQIANVIRRHRPRVVLAPYWRDRHPDHAAAGRIVRNSATYCTLKQSSSPDPPHKPQAFLYYLLHDIRRPSFVVDVSDVYSKKLALLELHRSQFSKTAEEFGVLAHGPSDYLFGLESRDRFFGSLIGVRHGEAVVGDRPLALRSLIDLPGL